MGTSADNCQLLCNIVLDYAKKAYFAGLFAGTSGNLSIIDRKEKVIAITASGARYEDMELDDVHLVSSCGQKLAGRGKPSSELAMHIEIYRAMPHIGAIAHTHSPYATAFAAAGKGIPCALIEMVYFLGGDIRCAPVALPGTVDVGTGAVLALEGRGACLLANHGVVAVGADMPQAYLRAEYAEDAAKICAISAQIGGPKALDAKIIRRMKDE